MIPRGHSPVTLEKSLLLQNSPEVPEPVPSDGGAGVQEVGGVKTCIDEIVCFNY